MVSMGIFKACPAVSTYRTEFCIEVRVNYRSIRMIVIRASLVTRRDVNVLVWRHKNATSKARHTGSIATRRMGSDYAQLASMIQTGVLKHSVLLG